METDKAGSEPAGKSHRGVINRLRRFWQVHPGAPNILSTAGSFSPPVGSRIGPDRLDGYYIDFSAKADSTAWPPPWLPPREERIHVASTQLALGCIERYLGGDGDEWLATAVTIAEELLDEQGPDGGWPHLAPLKHSFWLTAPWLSAMAQGEGASLFVRLHNLTGDDRYATAARKALEPLRVPSREGGVRAELDGGFFPEEYPTDPPSYVLNGAIFALWGCRDVGIGLDDAAALALYEEGVDTLARSIKRFDTGYWSLYDLFPHPIANVASGAYHQLHITQLEALQLVSPRPEFAATIDRWRGYQTSSRSQRRAMAKKVAFRFAVPRSRRLAFRLPWSRRGRAGEVLVLCYHAVSDTWPSRLAVTEADLRAQLRLLVDRGYCGVTFTEAILGEPGGKRLVVTFDDGYKALLDRAAPILAELGIPGTVFVPTDFAGREEPMVWPGIDEWVTTQYSGELVPLNWEELRELADAGWEVGSHTRSHPRLTQLPDRDLVAELTESRAEIAQRLERPCRSIAYPYGDVDERVIAATRDAGYVAAAALPTRFDEPRRLAWPRVGIYRADTARAFRLKVSRMIRRLRRTAAWSMLGAVSRARSARAGRGER